MVRRPDLNRTYWLGFAFIFVAMLLPAYAGAQNILDTIGQTYKDASGGWDDALIPLAKSLFVKLALLELTWSAIWWTIERDDPNQVLVAFLKKIMPLMFFYAILLNFDTWIPAVIDGFTHAGQQAGGLDALTPSSVLDRGLEVSTRICEAAGQIGLFTGDAGKFILAGLSALAILLCFGVIAGQMLVTLIESYIIVTGGCLFLGFAGSRWTTTFAEKYISYAVSVGVKLFVTYLIIAAGDSVSRDWAARIGSDMKVGDYFTILAGALTYMFLAWQIPTLASSMLTGAVSMTLGSAAATAGTMAAGVAGAAGLAQAGLAGGANSVAGAFQAGNAAIGQAKAGGAQSMLGVAGGAIGALASAGAQGIGESIRGLGASSTGGTMAGRMNETAAGLREAAAAGTPAASVPGEQPAAPAPAPAASSTSSTPAAPGANAAGAPAAQERATPAAPASAGAAGSNSPGSTAAPASAGAAGSNSPGSTAAPASAGAAGSNSPGSTAAPASADAAGSNSPGSTAAPASAGAAGSNSPGSAAAPTASSNAAGPNAAQAPGSSNTPAAPPASSVIDTSGNIGQALADRDSGATQAPVAAPSAPSADANGAAPEAPAPTSADSSAATAAAPAAAEVPSMPAAPGSPPTPAAPEKPEERPNALQQLAEHVQALGNMPNDSAAGAGVQINLKHD